MKKLLSMVAILLCVCVRAAWEVRTETDKDGARYECFDGDPFSSRVYTLDNGMKVFLSRNSREPRIQAYVAVRAGSADDPARSTGLAHYFEHMMFKGNEEIASLNWEKEKPLLDEIEELFERRRASSDSKEREDLYKRIDALSLEASQYSNDEYWQLVRGLGADGTNAWTSYDETVYVSDIPRNQLEKFLYLESVRFSSIALRRFHTELEAVYEEYNRSRNSDSSRAWDALMRLTFQEHPYRRPILGDPKDLKAPSMRDIRRFFQEHYRPDNMALVLSGDLDYEETMRLVRKYFNTMRPYSGESSSSDERSQAAAREPVQNSVRSADVVGPNAEKLLIAYRFEPTLENEMMLDMAGSVLQNGKCGLFDLDLLLPQKVLSADAGTLPLRDALLFCISAAPAPGQTLEQLRDAILAELEKLKNGEFDPELPKAVVNNARMSLISISEDRGNAGRAMLDSFIRGVALSDQLRMLDEQEKLSAADIAAFARKNFRDNYSIVCKRTGEPTDLAPQEKPPITPVSVAPGFSQFAHRFVSLPSPPEADPVFPDFARDLHKESIRPGLDFYAMKNDWNERFTLKYEFPAGTLNEKELALALSWMSLLGTDRYSPEELKAKWYSLASSMGTFSDVDRCGFVLTGLQRNFDESLELFHHAIRHVKADAESFRALKGTIAKSRADRRKSASALLGAATAFVLYGPENYSTDILSSAEIDALNPEDLAARIRALLDYEHDVVYYGPAEPSHVRARVFAKGALPDRMKTFSKPDYFKIRPFAPEDSRDAEKAPSNIGVWMLDYPGAQAQIRIVRPDSVYARKPFVFAAVYNMLENTVFMQELREREALAYAVGTAYQNPTISPDNYSLSMGAIGAQHDKAERAIDAMLGLLNKPMAPRHYFDNAKVRILSAARTTRFQKEDYYDLLRSMEKAGLDRTETQILLEGIGSYDLEQFQKDCAERVAKKPGAIIVVCDFSKAPPEHFKKYGPVRILTPDDVFPND